MGTWDAVDAWSELRSGKMIAKEIWCGANLGVGTSSRIFCGLRRRELQNKRPDKKKGKEKKEAWSKCEIKTLHGSHADDGQALQMQHIQYTHTHSLKSLTFHVVIRIILLNVSYSWKK